ncbi:EmrB/QacA subfamily drug resistance transporter [Kineococcus radiotolerans]|uniref:EmrB/QacA subfamily drug resistance transporter n=1 Tax=Kineococcus radiotolerans TaxID=131568 RepID=A0A7W4TPA3_KINRA|nr:MDR family MFS transporter [Kineococcus radiotolerans]MBB2902624.1 EmrB/QacA subfamily drug resistance transporter [Kineococcus radiotolerans]
MSSTPAGSPPASASTDTPALSHRQILAILYGLLLGMFLGALDQTIVSTAIRTIADDLDGFSLQAWATTAFLITSTISTPLYGKLSDMYGRRPFFIAAIVIFVIGSALCGISTSMYELAAFRALQGLGAGGLMSLALTIIADIVPARERARYQAYFMMVFGTSSVLGPVAGGFLSGQDSIVGLDGWRWIFWINVPLGALALFVVLKNLKLPKRTTKHRIDWPGALTLILCLVPLLLVAEEGRTWGWGSTEALVCYGLGLIGLIGFVLAERAYGEEALLPLRMFRGRTFVVGSLGSLILGMGMFGGFAVLPQYLQVVKGSTPTEGGLQMLPVVVGIMSASMFSGKFIARTGKYKVLPVVGTGLMVVALFLFSRVNADTPIWQTMIAMLLLGWGLGGNMQPIILAVQNAAARTEIGVATSSVTFFRQMGGTLGTAVFLSILFSSLGTHVADEYAKAGPTPAFQAGLAEAGLDQAGLQATLARATDNTSVLSTLPAVVSHPFKVGFTDSTSLIYLVAAGVMLLGFVTVLFLPALPLRGAPGAAAPTPGPEGAAVAAPAEAAGAPTEVVPPAPTPAPAPAPAPATPGASRSSAGTVAAVDGMAPGELAERLRSGVQQAKAAQLAMAELALEAERREAAFDAAVENLRELGLDEDSIEAALGEEAATPRGRHAGSHEVTAQAAQQELGAQN